MAAIVRIIRPSRPSRYWVLVLQRGDRVDYQAFDTYQCMRTRKR